MSGMKKLSLAVQGNPCEQWCSWIDALSRSGFEINLIRPTVGEPPDANTESGDTIVLDGMLPNLARLIVCICARHPDSQIIVATASDSFTIKYEVLHLNGAIYVSGPMASERFVETIRGFSEMEIAVA